MRPLLLALLLFISLPAPALAQQTLQAGPSLAVAIQSTLFADLPTSGLLANKTTRFVTDCLTTDCTAGGGSTLRQLVWDGTTWVKPGGGIDTEVDPVRNVTGLSSFANAMCWGDGDDKVCAYVSAGATPKIVFVCNGVEGGCDYDEQHLTGFKRNLRNNAGTVVGTLDANAGTMTGVYLNQFMSFGLDDQTVSDTDYLQRANFEATTGAIATDANAKNIIPFTGNITEIYCKSETAPGGAQTHIYTVATVATPQGSLADSTMVLTITSTATSGSSTTNPVAVTKGDFAGIKKVDSATAAASNYTVCFLKLVGS